MPAPDWENLDQFLAEEDFAVPVELRRDGNLLRTISAIFDAPFLNAELGEYELDTVQPRLTCKAADVADVVRGDECVVDGATLDVVRSPEPDGSGLAIVPLAPRGP